MTEFCLLRLNVLADSLRLVVLGLRSNSSLAAENLFCANSSGSIRNAKSNPAELPLQHR